MSASLPFSVPDARSRLFGSKDEYLAFTAAWKALTHTRASLPSGFYAAHAILLGRDLYKAFSPSKRPHDQGQPYRALFQAFEHLSRLNSHSKYFEIEFDGLSQEHAEVLRVNILMAASVVGSLDLTSYSGDRKAIVTGAGQFAKWALPAASGQTVEA